MKTCFVSNVSVSCYRNLTDYDKVFAEGLRYADVLIVISDSTSLSSYGKKSVSHLNSTQRLSALPQILAEKMSIEPNYRPKKISVSWCCHCMINVSEDSLRQR